MSQYLKINKTAKLEQAFAQTMPQYKELRMKDKITAFQFLLNQEEAYPNEAAFIYDCIQALVNCLKLDIHALKEDASYGLVGQVMHKPQFDKILTIYANNLIKQCSNWATEEKDKPENQNPVRMENLLKRIEGRKKSIDRTIESIVSFKNQYQPIVSPLKSETVIKVPPIRLESASKNSFFSDNSVYDPMHRLLIELGQHIANDNPVSALKTLHGLCRVACTTNNSFKNFFHAEKYATDTDSARSLLALMQNRTEFQTLLQLKNPEAVLKQALDTDVDSFIALFPYGVATTAGTSPEG